MNIPESMAAMVFERAGQPLVQKTVPVPSPCSQQILIKIIACGVCRTDLHIIDGELNNPKFPLIPGHEIIGQVVQTGKEVVTCKKGDIIGVPWLGYTCGKCRYCLLRKENLCENALFTGYTIDGGFAEYTVAYEQYCFHIDEKFSNPAGAPLMCAGLIGYRSYSMIGEDSQNIGIYGFGAAAHILIQVAIHQGKKVFAFTKKDDFTAQSFALKLGATWAGDSTQNPPEKLDAAIIFAPVGSLVPKALQDVDKSGTVICGGIHMSDIPSFSYDILWGERMIRSVANLTRKDGYDFLILAAEVPVKTDVQLFSLQQANEALNKLRKGELHASAAVLVM